jgi:DNA-dependent RNA polymerase auxiliary subunit epsilon
MLKKHFEHIFCINLARRKDRREEAEKEFEKYKITGVEFIEAVDGKTLDFEKTISKDGSEVSRGDWGCTLSHLSVVKIAKERGLKNYFVFEDDAKMIEGFNDDLIESYMRYVPLDWSLLYFGGSHIGDLQKVNHRISKMTETYTTHAIGVNSSMYDELINVWSNIEKVDLGISSLHRKFNCYCTNQKLIYQGDGFSDILEKQVSYEHLKK